MLHKKFIVIRIIVLLLISGFVYLFVDFAMAVEPESSQILTILFGSLLASISQLGLFLSTTQIGIKYKLLTYVLMLPFTIFLVGAAYDVIERLVAGNPLSLLPTIAYIIGITTYVYSYTNVFKAVPNAT